jgi:hypothetical protein
MMHPVRVGPTRTGCHPHCGWLWKFLYLKNICLGTNVNRCKHVEYVDVAKEEEAGPLLDMLWPTWHGNPSSGADIDHVVSGEDFIIDQFVLLLYPNSFVKKQTIISLCEWIVSTEGLHDFSTKSGFGRQNL